MHCRFGLDGPIFEKGEGRNLLKLQLLSECQMAAWARPGKTKAGCAHTVKKRLGFVKGKKARTTWLCRRLDMVAALE